MCFLVMLDFLKIIHIIHNKVVYVAQAQTLSFKALA